MTDQEIINRIKAGEEEPFRFLVETHQEFVYRTCIGLLHDPQEADDISQEVFIEVFESIPSFRLESKLSTWIYRIAVNKSLNQLKRLKRKKLFSRLEDILPGKSSSFSSGMLISEENDNKLEEKERIRLLQDAIGSLPENQRIAFTLFRYDELSHKEIATIMNLSLSSVESLVHRAKLGLQKKLFHYYKNNL